MSQSSQVCTVHRCTSLTERSQNTVLLASTQAVYKAPHSTVRHTQEESQSQTHTQQ